VYCLPLPAYCPACRGKGWTETSPLECDPMYCPHHALYCPPPHLYWQGLDRDLPPGVRPRQAAGPVLLTVLLPTVTLYCSTLACRGWTETFPLEYDPGKLWNSGFTYFNDANFPLPTCLTNSGKPVMSVGFRGKSSSTDGEPGGSAGGAVVLEAVQFVGSHIIWPHSQRRLAGAASGGRLLVPLTMPHNHATPCHSLRHGLSSHGTSVV